MANIALSATTTKRKARFFCFLSTFKARSKLNTTVLQAVRLYIENDVIILVISLYNMNSSRWHE